MKTIASTIALTLAITGCAYHSTMGENKRFHVDSTSSLFAPSVTTVTDTKHDSAQTFAGPSVAGQLAGAAAVASGSALIGAGLRKSGTSVSQNGGGANANSAPSLNQSQSATPSASSTSTSTVNIAP